MICIPIGFRCGYWPRLQANVNAPALRRHTFFFRLRGLSDCISHFWNEKTVTNRIKQIFQDWRPLKWSFAHAKISEFLLVYSGEPTCFPYTCCFTYGLGESNKKKIVETECLCYILVQATVSTNSIATTPNEMTKTYGILRWHNDYYIYICIYKNISQNLSAWWAQWNLCSEME